MPFVKVNPNEYLVVGRGGKAFNYGTATGKFLWPGTTFVIIPSTQQETSFEMTQESLDGIPLRFKGIIVYRISVPEVAAKRFDFSRRQGHEEIKTMISHVSLGELRATVSHLTMKECIEQRKTTLTNAVRNALDEVVKGSESGAGWGIDIDLVQVAQVFIVDNELRRQLEAEVRNQIKSTSDLSDIHMQEEIQFAKVVSRRKLEHENLETEKQHVNIAEETFQLQKRLEKSEIEEDTPVQMLKMERKLELLQKELELRKLEYETREFAVRTDLLAEKAKQELRKEILPLEQVPEIAGAVSQIFKGANLSVYGETAQPLFSTIGPLVDLLANSLRHAGISGSQAETDGQSQAG
jgi:regulator of protease activity HflC (stomatin/prohibitin superfamily)